jgi:hypothetical protein
MKSTSCLTERKRMASPEATSSTRPWRRLRAPPTGSNWMTNARSVCLSLGRQPAGGGFSRSGRASTIRLDCAFIGCVR